MCILVYNVKTLCVLGVNLKENHKDSDVDKFGTEYFQM